MDMDFYGKEYDHRFGMIKNYIYSSLGGDIIDVYLTPQMILKNILFAYRKFYDKAALDYNIVTVNVIDNRAEIPEGIHPKFIEDIIFPANIFENITNSLMLGASIPGAEGAVMSLGSLLGMASPNGALNKFDTGLWYQHMQRIEDMRNAVGIRKFWDIVNGKIELYPKNLHHTSVGILTKGGMTDDDIESETWIYEYALALSKIDTGTIKMRFSGIQAAGGNIAADGESLKSEGREDKKQLEEELEFLQKPLPFMQLEG